ncbi:hypothetical protein EW026_g528 [Hermanssonia centrifuga]|uniref:MOSC domain-containing protein n=1 Tax=Hermanssonia centrifuga TaxID=98765 RepID=A0A4S4KUF2_9APHY|nr:hypothetical protein EW026_g528 [Hermanssonia centrifuga]
MDSPANPSVWLLTAVALLFSAVFVVKSKYWLFGTILSVSTLDTEDAVPDSYAFRQQEVAAKIGKVYVTKILVHPIKSCRGTAVSECRYTPIGLENDRKWCIIETNTHNVVTAREVPKMVLVHPQLQYDAHSPYGGNLVISVPFDSGTVKFCVPIDPTPEMLSDWPIVEDCHMWGAKIDGYVCQALPPSSASPSEILSEYMGRHVFLIMKGPTLRPCPPSLAFPGLKANTDFQDGYPLLFASEESLEEVDKAIRKAAHVGPGEPGKVGAMDQERWKKGKIEMERFRPNIVIKGAGIPFAEDMWQTVAIGPTDGQPKESKTFTLVSKCARCLLPNVDTRSGVRDAAVPYKVLMKFRTGVDPANLTKPCFGCNGVPAGNGVIRVGDIVAVKEWASADY